LRYFASVAANSVVWAESPGHDALKKARYYADLYNWGAADPLFKRAAILLRVSDPKNALYAHIGALRQDRNRPVVGISQEIAQLLTDNLYLTHDDELRLFALTVKGDLDGELDARTSAGVQ
jgi:hypothetical protein